MPQRLAGRDGGRITSAVTASLGRRAGGAVWIAIRQGCATCAPNRESRDRYTDQLGSLANITSSESLQSG
jgi:hypothetical protein